MVCPKLASYDAEELGPLEKVQFYGDKEVLVVDSSSEE